MFFGRLDGLKHAIDAEDKVLVREVVGERLAAIFKLEVPALKVQADPAVDSIGD